MARTLAALHASGAAHRDITPANVFVGRRRSLILGDFGIAQHGLSGKGPLSSKFTPDFVAASVYEGRLRWLFSDDVYQLGLLGLGLLLGEITIKPDWRSLRHRLNVSRLSHVLQRATGPRRDRFPSAAEFHEALIGV